MVADFFNCNCFLLNFILLILCVYYLVPLHFLSLSKKSDALRMDNLNE